MNKTLPYSFILSKRETAKEAEELYIENYKTLMKEIKDNINRWGDIPCPWVGRINPVKITTTKCSLQIQCDPYQITNGTFHRTRTKKFHNSYGNTKDLNSQSCPEKKEWIWKNQPS